MGIATHSGPLGTVIATSPDGARGPRVDLTDPHATGKLVQKSAPDVVVNAAYTAVDKAKQSPSSPGASMPKHPACSATCCANVVSPSSTTPQISCLRATLNSPIARTTSRGL